MVNGRKQQVRTVLARVYGRNGVERSGFRSAVHLACGRVGSAETALGSLTVQKRRLARLVLTAVLLGGAAVGAAGCGGSKAGSGRTSPPSTTGS